MSENDEDPGEHLMRDIDRRPPELNALNAMFVNAILERRGMLIRLRQVLREVLDEVGVDTDLRQFFAEFSDRIEAKDPEMFQELTDATKEALLAERAFDLGWTLDSDGSPVPPAG